MDFSRDSDFGICAALCILMSLDFDACDGVTTVGDIISGLDSSVSEAQRKDERITHEDSCYALKRMARDNGRLCSLVIDKQTDKLGYHPDGLRAAVFNDKKMNIIAIRGTGAGEWSDNAIALLGERQTNTYYSYDRRGEIASATIREEYASTQQAQVLDYFLRVATQNRWKKGDNIIVTGHSKGGNKAQFITLNSSVVSRCYSFCGQGFSPEAVEDFKARLGAGRYGARTDKMYSLSSYNDFVNVMGDRIVPDEHTFYFDSPQIEYTLQYHMISSFVGDDGVFCEQRERGSLSEMGERLWDETKRSPDRGAVSMSMMTMCEYYFGNGVSINGEYVSPGTLLFGGGTAAGILLLDLSREIVKAGVNAIPKSYRLMFSEYYETEIKPRADSVKKSPFGSAFSKAYGKVRGALSLRPLDREVKTGSKDPYFCIDTQSLRLNADRISRICATIDAVRAKQRNSGEFDAAKDKKLGDEKNKLERIERHIRQVCLEFETADSELAGLARLVLKSGERR